MKRFLLLFALLTLSIPGCNRADILVHKESHLHPTYTALDLLQRMPDWKQQSMSIVLRVSLVSLHQLGRQDLCQGNFKIYRGMGSPQTLVETALKCRMDQQALEFGAGIDGERQQTLRIEMLLLIARESQDKLVSEGAFDLAIDSLKDFDTRISLKASTLSGIGREEFLRGARLFEAFIEFAETCESLGERGMARNFLNRAMGVGTNDRKSYEDAAVLAHRVGLESVFLTCLQWSTPDFDFVEKKVQFEMEINRIDVMLKTGQEKQAQRLLEAAIKNFPQTDIPESSETDDDAARSPFDLLARATLNVEGEHAALQYVEATGSIEPILAVSSHLREKSSCLHVLRLYHKLQPSKHERKGAKIDLAITLLKPLAQHGSDFQTEIETLVSEVLTACASDNSPNAPRDKVNNLSFLGAEMAKYSIEPTKEHTLQLKSILDSSKTED